MPPYLVHKISFKESQHLENISFLIFYQFVCSKDLNEKVALKASKMWFSYHSKISAYIFLKLKKKRNKICLLVEIKMKVLTNIRRLESLEIVLGMASVCNLRVLYHQCSYKAKEETVEKCSDVTFFIKSVRVVGTYFLAVILAFWGDVGDTMEQEIPVSQP